jgi:histone-lysine N-methyltransferase SETD3
MANHSLAPNCEVISDADGTVRMFATVPIAANSPLTLKYGPHCNSELLLSYGFVLPDNPHTCFRWTYDTDILTVSAMGGMACGMQFRPKLAAPNVV